MDNMDSIEVRIPDNVRNYREKYGGFTFRQWIGIALVVLVCVPVYYLLNKYTVRMFAMVITMVLAAPIGVLFFVQINELDAEKMIPYMKRQFVDYGIVLKFETEAEKEVDTEMMKDKKYRKQMKRLEKLERKNQKRIDRGDPDEENEKLRQMRVEIDAYNAELRNEKIHNLITGVTPMTRKEKKELRKKSKELEKSKKQFSEVSESETEEISFENESSEIQEEAQDKKSYGNSATYDKKSYTSNILNNESTRDEDGSHAELDDKEEDDASLKLENSQDSSFEGQDIQEEKEENTQDSIQNSSIEVEAHDEKIEKETEEVKTLDTESSKYSNFMQSAGFGDLMQAEMDMESSTMSSDDSSSTDDTDEESEEQTENENSEVVEEKPLTKRQIVENYYFEHQGATPEGCQKLTGIKMKLIRKYWPDQEKLK